MGWIDESYIKASGVEIHMCFKEKGIDNSAKGVRLHLNAYLISFPCPKALAYY